MVYWCISVYHSYKNSIWKYPIKTVWCLLALIDSCNNHTCLMYNSLYHTVHVILLYTDHICIWHTLTHSVAKWPHNFGKILIHIKGCMPAANSVVIISFKWNANLGFWPSNICWKTLVSYDTSYISMWKWELYMVLKLHMIWNGILPYWSCVTLISLLFIVCVIYGSCLCSSHVHQLPIQWLNCRAKRLLYSQRIVGHKYVMGNHFG